MEKKRGQLGQQTQRESVAFGVYQEWMWGDRHIALKRYGELFVCFGAIVGQEHQSAEIQRKLEIDFGPIDTPRKGLHLAWKNYNSSVIMTMPIVRQVKTLIPIPLEGYILGTDYDCLNGLSPGDINRLAEWALITAHKEFPHRMKPSLSPRFDTRVVNIETFWRQVPPPVFSHLRPQSIPSWSTRRPLDPDLPVYFAFQAATRRGAELFPLQTNTAIISDQPIFLIKFDAIFDMLDGISWDPKRPINNRFVRFALDALIDFGPVPRIIPVIPLPYRILFDKRNPYSDESDCTQDAHHLFRASSTTVPYHIRNWPCSRDITIRPYPWTRTRPFEHIDMYDDGTQIPHSIEPPHRLKKPELLPYVASADSFQHHVWPSHQRLLTTDLSKLKAEHMDIDSIACPGNYQGRPFLDGDLFISNP